MKIHKSDINRKLYQLKDIINNLLKSLPCNRYLKSIYGERNCRPNLGNICQALSNLFSNVLRCSDVKINDGSKNYEVLERRCMGSIFLWQQKE